MFDKMDTKKRLLDEILSHIDSKYGEEGLKPKAVEVDVAEGKPGEASPDKIGHDEIRHMVEKGHDPMALGKEEPEGLGDESDDDKLSPEDLKLLLEELSHGRD